MRFMAHPAVLLVEWHIVLNHLLHIVADGAVLLKRRAPDMRMMAGSAIAVLAVQTLVVQHLAFLWMAARAGPVTFVAEAADKVAALTVTVFFRQVAAASVEHPLVAVQARFTDNLSLGEVRAVALSAVRGVSWNVMDQHRLAWEVAAAAKLLAALALAVGDVAHQTRAVCAL